MTSRSAAMCASWFVFPIAKHQQSTSKAPAKHQQSTSNASKAPATAMDLRVVAFLITLLC